MPPEEVVGAVMLDTGADPVLTPIVVVDFCFKSFATGKDVVPAIFVVVAIASIGKELQGVLAMGRSSETAQFLVKFDEGLQQVLCCVTQEALMRITCCLIVVCMTIRSMKQGVTFSKIWRLSLRS